MADLSNPSRLRDAGAHLAMARDHLVVGTVDAAHSAKQAMRAIKDEAGDGLQSVLDKGGDLLASSGRAIARRPWIAIAGTIAAGYLLTTWLRRR